MAYLLIVAGVVSIVLGIIMLNKVPAEKQIIERVDVQEKIVYKDRIVEKEVPAKISPAPPKKDYQYQDNTKDNSSKQSNYEENKAKGDAFESFVVKNFNPKYFTLMEWRSDKYVDGVYAVSNHFPDLEVRFKLKNENDTFAVECKYRSRFNDDQIEWTKDNQFDQYKEYALRLNIPVFVVIGIGNTPSSPEQLYSVPLHAFKSTKVSSAFLRPYKKDIKKNFYWDEKKKALL